eukprot:13890596-Heterocapsa_arctica.AAC.1
MVMRVRLLMFMMFQKRPNFVQAIIVFLSLSVTSFCAELSASTRPPKYFTDSRRFVPIPCGSHSGRNRTFASLVRCLTLKLTKICFLPLFRQRLAVAQHCSYA